MDPSAPLILSLIAFLSVFVFFLGLQRVITASTEDIESRLDRYAARMVAQTETAPAEKPERLRGLGGLLGSDTAKKIATELGRADIKLTPSEYIALNILAVIFGFGLMFVLGRGSLILGLLGGVLGFYAPRLWVRQMQARRLNAFNNQLGDTLILLSNSLRSGYSLLQSLETVSRELPPPMSTEFARVVREIGLGLTIEEALAHMLERIQSDDLDLVITAINIQHEVGGNLAEILDTIAHTIRERVRIKGQIRALTAQQRFSGYVVSLLPFILGVVLFMINPTYIGQMFTEPCGIVMLITAGLMIVSGYIIIGRITNIEV